MVNAGKQVWLTHLSRMSAQAACACKWNCISLGLAWAKEEFADDPAVNPDASTWFGFLTQGHVRPSSPACIWRYYKALVFKVSIYNHLKRYEQRAILRETRDETIKAIYKSKERVSLPGIDAVTVSRTCVWGRHSAWARWNDADAAKLASILGKKNVRLVTETATTITRQTGRKAETTKQTRPVSLQIKIPGADLIVELARSDLHIFPPSRLAK